MPSHHFLATVLTAAALCGALLTSGAESATPINDAGETLLLRFPATNGESIVFTHGGQLYTVGMEGGTARRLTDAPGYAMFPRFSADGAHLAFTAHYDGNTEVYVMPAPGGTPSRLTFSATLDRDDVSDRMGPNNIVMAWKNTSNEVAFRSRWRSFNAFTGHLYTVGMDGDLPTQIPVPIGGFLSFSPDDTKIAYNRVFREFRTWKNYRGGMADDVWIFDLKSGALENITDNPAQDIIPMWAPDGRIYFISDRTGRMNLYSFGTATRETAQHTEFTDYDIKFPSIGRGGIVFEQAGRIWHFDLATHRSHPVPVTILEDGVGARSVLTNVSRFIQTIEPSPDGQRAVVVARGDVFTVPAKNGPTRNITRSQGVHERNAVWSPDGKWIAYISDASGENEITLLSSRAPQGGGEPVQVTRDADTYYFRPAWSPDSKKLLWADRKQRLRFVDIETRAVTLVFENPESPFFQFDWSPDSKWIAWTEARRGALTKINLFSVESGTSIPATDGWYASNNPAFSDDGKWLLFASARDFRPIYSDTEFNHAYQDMDRVYMLALAKDTVSPFAPKSDETAVSGKDSAVQQNGPEPKTDAPAKSDDAKKSDEPKKPAVKKPVTVKVDADGLPERIVGLPIAPSNYSSLRMLGDRVFYRRVPGGPFVGGGGGEGFGATRNERSVIATYSLKDLKETELGNFDSFSITDDGKRMLVRSGRDVGFVDLPSAKIELKDKLDFSALDIRLDRAAEWTQIFNESWRQMRDFFYAPNMHGINWAAQRDKYAALLPYVRHRNDLTYLIGEMIGELRVGHTYVGGGDRPETPRVKTGLLGAEFSRDPASRAYRIDRILKGDNWQTKTRSPLTEIGVNVAEGEYILAVDGQPVAAMENLYASLVGTVGRQVSLRVAKTASGEGARDVTVVPIADEAPLYYEALVAKNIARVAERTGGRAGYLHIPDMGPQGLNEFVRRFYPQLNKEALVIDVRGNGGGNVSGQIIERLAREVLMFNVGRSGVPTPNPGSQLVGHKVTLINQYSASDGDLFPFRFRELGLGKLVGKRTWGGVIGIGGPQPLTDGGVLNTPMSRPYAKDGSDWIIEGIGVEPDIVVDNDPAREFRGEDQQLDRAIDVLLEKLGDAKKQFPPPPPLPSL